jgi:tetratricopeptide (TPR) repeat protein
MRTAQHFLVGLIVLSSLALPHSVRGQDGEWNRSIAAGDSAMAKQQYPEAEATYREGLALAETRWKRDARISASLLKVAQACNAQGKQQEAETLAKRSAISMHEALKAHKPRDSSEEYQQLTVSSVLFDKIGELFIANQQYQDAENMYQESLNRWQEYITKPEPKKKNNEDALRFLTQTLVNTPQEYVNTGMRLEALYEKQGKSDQAKALCQQLASTTGRLYKPNEPQIVPAITPIAIAEVRLRDYASAEPLFRRAIDALSSPKYKDSAQMASALENYALFLKKAGREIEAKPFIEKASLIRASSSAAQH